MLASPASQLRLRAQSAALTSPPSLQTRAGPQVGQLSRPEATDMLSAAGLTAAPALSLVGCKPPARWYESLSDGIVDGGHGVSSARLQPPAQHGSPAAPMPSLQPAAASHTFSPFACFADRHVNGVQSPQQLLTPLRQAPPLSLQLLHPRLEAGSVADTPRSGALADSYGWASDGTPLDGDSADGMSPRSGAGEGGGDGVGVTMLALHANGGELLLCSICRPLENC